MAEIIPSHGQANIRRFLQNAYRDKATTGVTKEHLKFLQRLTGTKGFEIKLVHPKRKALKPDEIKLPKKFLTDTGVITAILKENRKTVKVKDTKPVYELNENFLRGLEHLSELVKFGGDYKSKQISFHDQKKPTIKLLNTGDYAGAVNEAVTRLLEDAEREKTIFTYA